MPCSYRAGAVFQIKREAVFLGDKPLDTSLCGKYVVLDKERKIR